MGGTTAGVWKVGGESDLGGPSTRGEVHMEQIIRVLQAAFQINQETLDRIRADIKSKPVSSIPRDELTLPILNLHSALKLYFLDIFCTFTYAYVHINL